LVGASHPGVTGVYSRATTNFSGRKIRLFLQFVVVLFYQLKSVPHKQGPAKAFLGQVPHTIMNANGAGRFSLANPSCSKIRFFSTF
jgi:hypothetical protein